MEEDNEEETYPLSDLPCALNSQCDSEIMTQMDTLPQIDSLTQMDDTQAQVLELSQEDAMPVTQAQQQYKESTTRKSPSSALKEKSIGSFATSPSSLMICRDVMNSPLLGQKRNMSSLRTSSTSSLSSVTSSGSQNKKRAISIIPGSSISQSQSKPAGLSRNRSGSITRSETGLKARSPVTRSQSPTKASRTSPKKASPSMEASTSKKQSPGKKTRRSPQKGVSSAKSAADPHSDSAEAASPLELPPPSLGVVLNRVKCRLQASYMPPVVLERQEELNQIYQGVKESLLSYHGTAIRVAGAPGQGKTLTTKHVLKLLKEDEDVTVPFTTLFLKGSDFTSSFKFLAEQLNMTGLNEASAMSAVQNDFCYSNSSVGKLVLVIDEIDMTPHNFERNLLNMVKSENSRVVLIGLANKTTAEEYASEVVFEVYKEENILVILGSLTENLIHLNGQKLLAKTATSDGDIRPMTTLAMSCLELVGTRLSEEDLLQPASAVVTLKIVQEAKRDSGPLDMEERLKGLSKGALLALVALALQHSEGDLFSFADMSSLLNTHLETLQINTCNGSEVESRKNELLNSSFMIETSHHKKKSDRDMKYTLGINASDLLQEKFRDVLNKQNWQHLEEVVAMRRTQMRE
jgi:hypothetical protein